MAKRGRKRSSKKNNNDITITLIGIAYILLGIFGIFKVGMVGQIMYALFSFLVGKLNIVVLVCLILFGTYTIFQKKYPYPFKARMIGIYLILIGALLYFHRGFVLDYKISTDIISKSFDIIKPIFEIISGASEAIVENTGGGIIGSLLYALSFKLFDETGTEIIYWVFFISGIVFVTGISIVDIIKSFVNKSKDLLIEEVEDSDNTMEHTSILKTIKGKESQISIFDSSKKEDKEEIEEELSKTKTQPKIINSLDELKSKPKEELKEEPIIIDNTNNNYRLPTCDLLDVPKQSTNTQSAEVINENFNKIIKVLSDFGIFASGERATVGPACTQYELSLKAATKLSKITSLNKEISLALAKKDVRIEAPIPGKSTVGIEIANDSPTTVYIREIMEAVPKDKANKKLLVALGKDINGNVRFCEINKTPHMLVAGSTGSGKSVCINCILASILMRTKPDEVKLLLVDPKKVELSIYNGAPHLLRPVVTDPKKASQALQLIVQEMEHRYDTFEQTKVKNIETYNEYVDKENKNRAADDQIKKMPFIVVIIDELADLMMVASKEVEDSIMRITQMARAAGIHLIVATQRPSTDVITGVIKANIPSRLSFAVSSGIDSRTILDMTGAEKLLGRGDMLFLPAGDNSPTRIQGAWITEDETKRIVDYVCNQQKASYDARFDSLDNINGHLSEVDANTELKEEYDDPLYDEIVEFVITSRKASASLLQRRFKLGYNRAARIVDLLEERGIIGPQNGSKPREVLVQLDGSVEEDDVI